MVEFVTTSGTRLLVNPNAISCIVEDGAKRCKMFLNNDGEDPWIIKGSLDEIHAELWVNEKDD